MDYFRDLRGSLDRMEMGPASYCLLVSGGQRILTHPQDRYEFPGPDSDLAKIPAAAGFRAMIARASRNAAGTAQTIDFSTGQSASFRFFRIPSSDWTLVTVSH
jgi:hypothetical protein